MIFITNVIMTFTLDVINYLRYFNTYSAFITIIINTLIFGLFKIGR